MELGLGQLQLPPDKFWNLSMVEWNCAVSGFSKFHNGGKGSSRGGSMSRARLQELMEQYPDGT